MAAHALSAILGVDNELCAPIKPTPPETSATRPSFKAFASVQEASLFLR